MNLLRALSLSYSLFFSITALANEPQQYFINKNLKVTADQSVDDLRELEISSEDAAPVYAFTVKKKINRSLASKKNQLPNNG